MAAFFARVGRRSDVWKLLLSSSSKLPLNSARCLPTKSQGILYLRCVGRNVSALGARHYSQETSFNSGELLQDSSAVSNPFITEQQTQSMDSLTSASDLLNAAADTVNSLGEPTLSSLGLGGSNPIGLCQQSIELIHTYFHLPWVWSIVAATIAFRILMFPLIVKAQANSARLNNIKPQLEEIQSQLQQLMNTNDAVGKATASFKMKQLYKDHNCHPMKSLLAPLIQLPFFISFFMGLRRMAELPVVSLQTGGMLWFTDLTTHDPYFVLPILCSLSMLASMELGGEAGVTNAQMKNMKQFFRAMCIIMIPLTAQFPTDVFVYWISSNIFSLGQVSLLKLKVVRKYFGIPDMIVHEDLTPQGGFWKNMKAGYSNAQESAYVKHHEKMKRQKQKALGIAPLEQTYKNNPRIKRNQEIFSPPDKLKQKD